MQKRKVNTLKFEGISWGRMKNHHICNKLDPDRNLDPEPQKPLSERQNPQTQTTKLRFKKCKCYNVEPGGEKRDPFDWFCECENGFNLKFSRSRCRSCCRELLGSSAAGQWWVQTKLGIGISSEKKRSMVSVSGFLNRFFWLLRKLSKI